MTYNLVKTLYYSFCKISKTIQRTLGKRNVVCVYFEQASLKKVRYLRKYKLLNIVNFIFLNKQDMLIDLIKS